MRFLLDANLSPRIAEPLRAAGYEVAHVADVDLVTASDPEIFDWAAAGGHVIITADSDFSLLLASRHAMSPSVVLLRGVADLRAPGHASLLVANLPSVLDDLAAGAIVSLSPTRMAVRRLPFRETRAGPQG